VAAGLQADARSAVMALRRVPADQFAGTDAVFRGRMLARFDRPEPPEEIPCVSDALARAVVRAYRTYWWQALTAPETAEQRSGELLRTLTALLGEAAEGSDALEPRLIARLSERGYRALLGITSPLHELMAWRQQETRTYEVALPEGTHTCRVEILDRFASLGWAHYATCGRRAAGGWATADALCAVRPRYTSLEDEEFRVTFLAHETQHLADIGRFSVMEPWELEYRAKLTELALADATRGRILQKFTEDQGDAISSPHAYANRRVLETVRARLAEGSASVDLSTVATDLLQGVARAALFEDSRRRPASAR
jgi:hypothetical protein